MTLGALGCADKKTSKEALNVPETEQKTGRIFKPVADFPVIKDTAKFIAELKQTFGVKVYQMPYQEKVNKITTFRKVKIYGSEKDFILIEYNWGTGAMVDYPWVYHHSLPELSKKIILSPNSMIISKTSLNPLKPQPKARNLPD
ncbi:hypothetical protein D0T08_10260 [Emticicia sp. C21]|nr:hypothetical protein D0T08_10260 [Emticicia sp. C21]